MVKRKFPSRTALWPGRHSCHATGPHLGVDRKPAPNESRRGKGRPGGAVAIGGGHIQILVTLFSGLLVGVMSSVLAISFTAIVFAGPLEAFLDRGIGMSLIATGIMAMTGAFLFSYRGTVMHPQDITAILLATGAASIAAAGSHLVPDALFATIVLMLITASVATGAALVTIGRLKLSYVVKFIPYPVLGGFLASTGYLLSIGAIGLLLKKSLTIGDLPGLFAPDTLPVWTPWVLVAIAIAVLTRRIKHGFVLPACVAATCIGFYLWLFATGTSIDQARAANAFLGPFSASGFLADVRPGDIWLAETPLVADQALTIVAAVAMAILGGALNLTGIELATKQSLDLDKDTTAMGVATLAAAPAGGILGFPALSNSILSFRLGLTSHAAGLIVAAVALGVALFGASALEYLPRGLFAAVIGFLGVDLLYTWLWSERRRLHIRDFLIVVLTVAVSATLGFLFALALGLFASVILFVVSYSRQSILRLQTDLSLRRSVVERDLSALDHLAAHGKATAIIELTGYIFFGTASKLRGTVQSVIDRTAGTTDLLIDFSRVQGIDPSAIHSLHQIDEFCKTRGVTLYVSGLSSGDRARVDRFLQGAALGKAVFPTLDAALQHLETKVLSMRDPASDDGAEGSFISALMRDHPDVILEDRFPTDHFGADETILRSGDASDELLIIRSGSAQVFVGPKDGTRTSVAHLLEGSLVGEIGFFTGTLRTADVVAAEKTSVLRVTHDALEDLLESDPAFVASFHHLAARYLSRRLDRTTKLLGAALR